MFFSWPPIVVVSSMCSFPVGFFHVPPFPCGTCIVASCRLSPDAPVVEKRACVVNIKISVRARCAILLAQEGCSSTSLVPLNPLLAQPGAPSQKIDRSESFPLGGCKGVAGLLKCFGRGILPPVLF